MGIKLRKVRRLKSLGSHSNSNSTTFKIQREHKLTVIGNAAYVQCGHVNIAMGTLTFE